MVPRPIRAFLLAATLAPLGACSLFRPHLERPTITVIAVELRRGNLLQQNFGVRLHIQNPNDRDLPVKNLHAELKVDGERIAAGDNDRDFVVPALGEADFDMTINADLMTAFAKLADRLNRHAEGIDYELDGSATVALPLHHHLPFHQSGVLPLKGS